MKHFAPASSKLKGRNLQRLALHGHMFASKLFYLLPTLALRQSPKTHRVNSVTHKVNFKMADLKIVECLPPAYSNSRGLTSFLCVHQHYSQKDLFKLVCKLKGGRCEVKS